MDNVEYKIRLQGLSTPEGTISLETLVTVSRMLLEASRRTLRLIVDGVSVKRGKVPDSLRRLLDFNITGISKGSTVLQIEAPTFEASAPDLIQQPGFWDDPIEPKDTVVSLLSKSVHDATSGNMESDYYDRGVLESLMSFRRLLKGRISNVEIKCQSRPAEEFRITDKELEKIKMLEADTPAPRATIVAGIFNRIEHDSRHFELVLESGQKVRGFAESSHVDVEQMRTLWGEKATVKGIGHFKPNGTIRSIEAQMIKAFSEGEELFEIVPQNRLPASLARGLGTKYGAGSPLQEIWGKWPGDESIDDILEALRQTSEEAV